MALTEVAVLTKLYEARDNLLKQKLELSLSPKPSYNIDGQDVKWTEYLKYLDGALKSIFDTISLYEGPYEESTQYCPI